MKPRHETWQRAPASAGFQDSANYRSMSRYLLPRLKHYDANVSAALIARSLAQSFHNVGRGESVAEVSAASLFYTADVGNHFGCHFGNHFGKNNEVGVTSNGHHPFK